VKSYPVERARHFVLRAGDGDVIPDDVVRVLSEEGVTCGWIRASGVLVEIELRVFDPMLGAPAESRRIAGPVQALSIEGSFGRERGEASLGLRAVLARETDRGMETLAGEILSARVVALEAFVTAFDDLVIGRALDAQANVVLLGDAADARYRRDGERPVAPAAAAPGAAPPTVKEAPPPAAASPAAWSDAIAASAEQDAARAIPAGALGGAIPPRPVRPQRAQDESSVPEAGDVVEHFAFGRSEVLKSDGDRLHLKVGKDGRIREIALEMLKVSPLESNGPHRRFRLDRKM
jgi:predicted DNA-binding protein with PD1-like motif